MRQAKKERHRLGTTCTPARPACQDVSQRRQAILDAALEEFSARGFAATRLDMSPGAPTVARHHLSLFPGQESLFQELVRAMIEPADRRDRSRRHAGLAHSRPGRAHSQYVVNESTARAARTLFG